MVNNSWLTHLPHDMEQLECLAELDLSGCRELTCLPTAIHKLSNLQTLILNGCGRLAELPPHLAHLTHLETLDLTECCGLMYCKDRVFAILARLPLVSLNLRGWHVTDLPAWMMRVWKSLTISIGSKYMFVTLVLTSEPVGAESMYLDRLLVSGWNPTLPPMEMIRPHMQPMMHLIHDTRLHTSSRCQHMPPALPDISWDRLTTLDLTNCVALQRLPEVMADLICLTRLNVCDCQALTVMPHSVLRLPRLTWLTMKGCTALECFESTTAIHMHGSSVLEYWNLYDCPKLSRLPEFMHWFQALKILSLCFNRLDISGSIKGLSSLVHLCLQHHGVGSCTSDTFANLPSLTHLDWSGGHLTLFPEAIGQLTSLTHLDMTHQGTLSHIPSNVFTHMAHLVHLNLSNTPITCLPESIGQLSALTRLDAHYCDRLIDIPASVGQLSRLSHVNLRQCSRLSMLPDSVGQLVNLVHLVLSGCGRLHTLPETIGNMSALVTLDFNRSGLCALPLTIGHLASLKSLDLTACYKIIWLPESICLLRNLTWMGIGNSEWISYVLETEGVVGPPVDYIRTRTGIRTSILYLILSARRRYRGHRRGHGWGIPTELWELVFCDYLKASFVSWTRGIRKWPLNP